MKKIALHISLFAALITSLTSCKNELDVLAPGEESVSVYGALNPNEPVQNIRINKVYITDGDALAAGLDANQINYGPGELKVTLQRFMAGSSTPTLTTVGDATKKEIVLTETVVTTASGNFSNQQRIWQTTDKLYKTGEYKLTITNVSSGKQFTSQTTVIDSVKTTNSIPTMPFYWSPTNPSAYPMHGSYVPPTSISPPPTQDNAYVKYETFTQTYKIKFKSVANAKLYRVSMRLHFLDYTTSTTSTANYVDMDFSTVKSPDLLANNDLEVVFTGNEFYDMVGRAMENKNSSGIIKRKIEYIEYTIRATTENMFDFLQVNAPSNSIAQDKPYYTNINGGVGIFASISKSWVTKDFSDITINKFACHPSTYPYKFMDSNGNIALTTCSQ